MKTAIIALTKNGCATAMRLYEAIKEDAAVSVYLKDTSAPKDAAGQGVVLFQQKLKELIQDIHKEFDAFVMIMATGIVVRTFAPYIEHKTVDPAIVVMDEKAQFAISLLSGHLGGANAFAHKVAKTMNAIPVITTATDVNGLIAFDNVAKENHCAIENIEMMQRISGALVNGKTVGLFSELPLQGNIPKEIIFFHNIYDYQKSKTESNVVVSNRIVEPKGKHTLYLRPRNLVLGIGCRRDTPFEKIEEALLDFMKAKEYSLLSLKAMASIDLKKDEAGLLRLAETYHLPFLTFSGEELKKVGNTTGNSSFVEQVTGTPSVSQAAALLAANNGTTVVEKTIYPGITLSLAEEPNILTIS